MPPLTDKPGLITRLRNRLAKRAKHKRLMRSIRHLHGPQQLDLGARDVVVMALVRDGGFYMEPFLAHYRALGARHFVFFDNGSQDNTLDLVRAQPDTSLVQSPLPWGEFENDFRRYAAETFCAGAWCLYADMDELFDFEDSARIGLPGLAAYLSAHGFSAMVAQMLEMFPKGPLRDHATLPFTQAIDQYRYFDISQIHHLPYHAPEIEFEFLLRDNTAPPEIAFQFGGVRGKVFGENCCLTKHPLVFVGLGVAPGVHPHCSSHVACADVTGVIRHYKFTNDPFGRDARLVEDAAIGHGEDKMRLNALGQNPDVSLYSEDAQIYGGVEDLYDRGFLTRSDRFSEFVQKGRA